MGMLGRAVMGITNTPCGGPGRAQWAMPRRVPYRGHSRAATGARGDPGDRPSDYLRENPPTIQNQPTTDWERTSHDTIT